MHRIEEENKIRKIASMNTTISEKRLLTSRMTHASSGRMLQNGIDDQPASRMFVGTYCLTHMDITKLKKWGTLVA
jgi:hypothetical protein